MNECVCVSAHTLLPDVTWFRVLQRTHTQDGGRASEAAPEGLGTRTTSTFG